MRDTKNYSRGTILFREGEPGDVMYDIQSGSVGIYHNYGGTSEKLIATLYAGDLFGEMGLLDHARRSADAVILEPDTVLSVVTEEDFYDFFRTNPSKILLMMQQMCSRLRRTSRDYAEACRTVHDAVDAEKAGKEKSQTLMDRIKKFCSLYAGFNFYAHT